MPKFTSTARRASGLACAALLAAALAPSAASAAFAVGEQVDRGDGASGASPWDSYYLPYDFTPKTDTNPHPFAISEDGRYAFLTYPTAAGKRGLYRRDVQANTLRLVLDDVQPTGRTTTGSSVSVVTSRALVAADVNGTADLYLVDPFTAAATLASATPTGGGVGAVSTGAVTADGTAVVYSAPGGTYRRVLTQATATRLSTRALDPLTAPFYPSSSSTLREANLSRQALSADGTRALLQGRFVATPAGDVSIADAEVDAPVMAPSGAFVANRSGNAVAIYDLASGGARRTVTAVLPANAYAPEVLSISADGKRAHVGVQLTRDGKPYFALGTLDLTTGAVAQTSEDLGQQYPRVFSINDRYAVAEDYRRLFAVPAVVGAALPGGVDPASPNVYLSYEDGCLKPSFITPNGGRPKLTFSRSQPSGRGYAPVASSLSVVVRQTSNNAVINRPPPLTASFSTAYINAVYTQLKLETTATFAGGKTTRDVAYVPAHTPDECYGNNGF